MKKNISSLKKMLSKAQRIQRDNIGKMTICIDINTTEADESLAWISLVVFSNENGKILCNVSPDNHNGQEENDLLFNVFVNAVIMNGGKVK